MRKKCRITIRIHQKIRQNICFLPNYCFGNVTEESVAVSEFNMKGNKSDKQNEQKQRK